jgi:predicted flap endonuclease-1-like 5' DNA nuclease
MHANQRAYLDQSINELKLNVEAFRAEATAERNRIHADYVAAQQTWTEFRKAGQQQHTETVQPSVVATPTQSEPKPVVAPVSKPAPSETKPPVAAAAPNPDNLTVIRGIGNGMQGRLNQLGIFTFADLAASSPEQLRAALAEVGRLVNVDEWLAEANKFMGQS